MNQSESIAKPTSTTDRTDSALLGSTTTALTISSPESAMVGRTVPVTAPSGGLSGWLHAFRRRWILALSLSVLGGAVGSAFGWFTWKPDYAPVATLRIASQQPVLMYETKDTLQQSTFDVYKKTQRELIRDPFVLNAALRDPSVSKLRVVSQQLDPVGWLQKEILVSFPGDAEILDISMRGSDPEVSTALVNAVCDAYIDQVVHTERNERMSRLQSLEKIHNDAEEKVRQKRSELKSLTETLGTGDSHAATQKQQIALESYAALRREQLTVQLELMRAEAKQAVIQAQLDGLNEQPLTRDVLDARIHAQPEFIAASQSLEKLHEDLQNVESLLAEGQQRIVENRRRDVASAERRLGELQTQLQPMVETQLRQELLQQAKTDLAAAQSEVSTKHAEDERLGKEVEKLGGEANQIGRSSVDLEMMKTELDNLETIRKQLATEVENMKIEMASSARVELLSRAEVPRWMDDKAHIRQAGTYGALGFFLPLAWVCWHDTRKKRVSTAQDVSSALGLPIIGTMPLLPPRAHQRLIGNSAPSIWNCLLTESIDSIREALMSESRTRALKVIIISSATAGEGKTTVAIQLAKSIARVGHRTLLMDCDLRCPATQLAFPESSGPGLMDVLTQKQELNAVIYPTHDSSLYHLPVGAFRAGSPELLGRGRNQVAAIFQQLRTQFDYIIVDSGPILPVVDTLVVGQFADAAVLSIMRDVSQSYEILEAQSRLARVGVKVLGAVVTCKGRGIYGSSYRNGYALSGNASAI